MKDALGDVQSLLVLGGTSEIAQAIVRALAARKRLHTVVLACRDPSAVATFAASVSGVATLFDADDIASHAGL